MILTPGQLGPGLVAGLLIVTACTGDDGSAAGSTPYVVATTGIWADVVRDVACDGTFEVRTLLPSGADTHAYEPSLRDRAVLDGASLVVTNGLGLEERLDDTLSAVEHDGVPVFRVGDHVATLTGGEDDHGGADPHVWFDPTRVSAAVPALGDALVEAGADRQRISTCVETTQHELADLDREVAATVAAVPPDRRELVTNHDSLAYFADRYGFKVLGEILPSTSTLTEASAGQLDDLGKKIQADRVPAIFAESVSSTADANALADRLGVDVVVLYTESLGEPGSGAGTYPELMRFDARAIAGALG